MAKFEEKIKARKLRLEGASILEIVQKLDQPKSTVSYWCKNIQLTPRQIERLVRKRFSAGYKGRLKAAELKRQKRLNEIEYLKKEGVKEIGKSLSTRELLLAGLGIYLGEGDKSLSGTALTSSDPKIAVFMLKWFKVVCQIPSKDFVLRVGLNEAHQQRIVEVEKHWSLSTGIPLDQFTKTTLIKAKTKKVYENPNNYYGTLRISIRRSTRLQRKILGWIEGLITAE